METDEAFQIENALFSSGLRPPLIGSDIAVYWWMRLALLNLCILLLLTSTSAADVYRIEGDSIVEGSLAHGGMQPDYFVSKNDPGLGPLLKEARAVGASKLSYWQKVAAIRTAVSKSLPGTDYDDPRYLALAKRYTKLGKPVPLGEYVKAGAGVCRENSIILHLALSEAGIKSDVAYVRADQAGHSEDHGLVVLRGGKGNGWTVDSYNENFNGVKFKKLLSAKGVNSKDSVAPEIGKRLKGPRRILGLTAYPKVRAIGDAVHSDAAPKSKLKRALGVFRIARNKQVSPKTPSRLKTSTRTRPAKKTKVTKSKKAAMTAKHR